jgi:hypothetical protein
MECGDPKLAVFVCSHVYKNQRPVNLVSHAGGDWQLMCGGVDHSPGEGHVVGVGHLLARDPSLHELGDLPVDWEAEREEPGKPWIRTRCAKDA